LTATSRPSSAPHISLFINGQWADAASGKTFETPNPATGETLARIAEGDAEDINRAVRAARAAFDDGPWSQMSPSERGRIIWRIGDLILEHVDELAQLESLDNGKPFAVAQGADMPLAADLFHYMAGWATKIEGNTINISVPYMPAPTSTPTPCASPSASSDRSSPGTSRC
jgi:phenylacetaldehyde dehydrogenase